MLEDYIEEQPIVTKILLNCFKNNKLVQAYLFTSNDKSFLLDYAKSFSKKLISENYDKNLCLQIDKNEYPELKIINPINNIIKKEQLLDLIKDFQVKPILGSKLVYIINDCDKLNTSSANTLLKFLEEPNENVVAILLTSNLSKVLPTIKSRCQIYKFNSKFKKNFFDNLKEKYININENSDNIDEEFNNFINNCIKIIDILETNKIYSLVELKNNYKEILDDKEKLKLFFEIILYFYYDIFNLFIQKSIVNFKDYSENIYKIKELNNIEFIQKKLIVIENTREELESNMNLKMLVTEFIIKFCEVSH